MGDTVDKALGLVVRRLSDQNYEQSLASYRFWLGIGQTYYQTPSGQISDVIWNNRAAMYSELNTTNGQLIHSTAHLILRFARDAESGHILVPHSSELQSRLRARSLQEFFTNNVETAWSGASWMSGAVGGFHTDVNLIAHWANLGYIEEAVIRDHILQSLINLSHSGLWDHQVEALIILFKLAGATFGAYADPSVVDRCFQLLNDYYLRLSNSHCRDSNVKAQIQVRAPSPVKGGHLTEAKFQEVVSLRDRGWQGLPPPPVFTTERPRPADEDQKDLTATPVATFLGLPNRVLEPQIPESPPLRSITTPEGVATPAPPVTQSPSISIATLSDFTIADTSDDESSIDPTIPDTSDDEPPIDPTTVTPHGTFYLEDGNVEVLCGNVLFRVHASTLSFHSPALRRMFVKTSLAGAESPNGCPRIPCSDMPKDFATLLKIVYLPEFVVPPVCRQFFR